MAFRADVLFQKLFHPLHAFLVLDLGKRVFHSIDGVEVGEVQFSCLIAVFGVVENVLFLRRTVIDNVLFPVRQFPEGDVGANAHFPAHVRHQGPHQAVPGGDGAFVNAERIVRNQRVQVHPADAAGAAAFGAGALGIEGQLFGGGSAEAHPAFGADQLFPGGHQQRRGNIVPVGTAMAGKPGIHEPQAVQQLRTCAEGAADAGDAGPLMQGQCGRHIEDLVHGGVSRLSHPAAGIGGQSFQIPAGSFRIEDPQGQRGFPGPGHTGNAYNPVQGNIHIDIFQVVYPRSPDLNGSGCGCGTVFFHGRAPCNEVESIIRLQKENVYREENRHSWHLANRLLAGFSGAVQDGPDAVGETAAACTRQLQQRKPL